MKHLTVNELINALKLFPEEMEVYYDFCGFMPTLDFRSYRGIYEDLAMGYIKEKDGYRAKALTVKCLRQGLDQVIGREFTGYKGGDFIMEGHTKVWVSGYGESDNTAIVGVNCYGSYQIVLETQRINW